MNENRETRSGERIVIENLEPKFVTRRRSIRSGIP